MLFCSSFVLLFICLRTDTFSTCTYHVYTLFCLSTIILRNSQFFLVYLNSTVSYHSRILCLQLAVSDASDLREIAIKALIYYNFYILYLHILQLILVFLIIN